MEKEISDLRAKLMEEQGDLGAYQERQAKLSAQKADLELQLQENLERLAAEERYRSSAGEGKKAAERELMNIKQVGSWTSIFTIIKQVAWNKSSLLPKIISQNTQTLQLN